LDTAPAWSPDGKKIAFTRITLGQPASFEVVVMNADGSGQTSLTPAPSENGSNPDWSPDGTKIVYTKGVPFPPEANLQGLQPDVFVMNADGSAKTGVTNTPSVIESDPVWSPDGTKIAFSAQPIAVGANADVFVMNADGSGQTNLTNDRSFEGAPDWMPVPTAPPPVSPPPPPPTAQACRVPKVVGLRLAAAKQRIRRASCTVGRIRKKHSTRVGRVLAQSPRPGTRLPRGGRVNLVVGRR
jgi:Tol biopolymer transport system component